MPMPSAFSVVVDQTRGAIREVTYRRGEEFMKRSAIVLLVLLLLCASYSAQPRSETRSQSLSEKVAGMQKFPGYFPFYWDAKAGKIWLEIDKWNSEFLYVESLPAGIGS